MLLSLTLSMSLICANSANYEPQHPLQVLVSTDQWPNYTNEDQTGIYFDLIRLILQPEHFDIGIQFTSFNRSIKDVMQQKSDLALAISVNDSNNLLLSEIPMDQDRIVALYHPGRTTIDGLSSLTNLRLAWNLAYDYGRILGIKNQGYEVANTKQGIDLVSKNRVDAYLAELSLLKAYERQTKLLSLKWILVGTDNVHVGFSNGNKGTYLKCYWDQQVAERIKDGSLKKFYQQHSDFFLSVQP